MSSTPPFLQRFERQTRFAPFGLRGQETIASSRVLLVGCGALGGVLAQWLARAGVGRIDLVDRDIVEETNLPRQVLFTAAHARAGTPKAMAAAESLAPIEGPTEIVPHALHLDRDALLDLGTGAELILDGTDNMRTRYLINDFSVSRGTPWIYGGVVSSGGLVLPVVPGSGPCLRCIFRDPPPPGTLPTCDTAGVLGPAVGAIASLQAGLALRLLAAPEGLKPTLVEIDVWTGGTRQLDVPRSEHCPACGERQFEFLDAAASVEAVSLCGRNTVQVMPQGGEVRVSYDAAIQRLEDSGVDVIRVGPITRFSTDGHRFTVFPDGRALVEGTEDSGRALALVSRWLGA